MIAERCALAWRKTMSCGRWVIRVYLGEHDSFGSLSPLSPPLPLFQTRTAAIDAILQGAAGPYAAVAAVRPQ